MSSSDISGGASGLLEKAANWIAARLPQQLAARGLHGPDECKNVYKDAGIVTVRRSFSIAGLAE